MPDRNQPEFVDQLRSMLPVPTEPLRLATLTDIRVELVIVDAVRGFTREGAMAAPEIMEPMVEAINGLAIRLIRTMGGRFQVSFFADRHAPDVPEPPYPKHCTTDTDEWKLDPELEWLASMSNAKTFYKQCINGVVGTFHFDPVRDGFVNNFIDRLKRFAPHKIIVVGDCTDICVSDLVVSLLSVRNCGLLSRSHTLPDVCVYEPACATYHFDNGKPEPGRHPEDATHHVGLWTMASRGAVIFDGML